MITYAFLDIRRLLRNTGGTIFTVLMPAGFYLIFGATQLYTDAAVAHGNVKATIMVSMAVYGAVMAVTTWGSHAALEQQRGWGRQLALTPMTPLKYVFSKVLAIETVALVPLAVVSPRVPSPMPASTGCAGCGPSCCAGCAPVSYTHLTLPTTPYV